MNKDKNNNVGAGDVAGEVMWVELSSVDLDGSVQGRVVTDAATVSEYSGVLERAYNAGVAGMGAGAVAGASVSEMVEAEREWWPFPAVVLFRDAKGVLYVGDGFHRVSAAHASEFLGCVAEVRDGGRPAALKYALGANASHGLKRSSEDLKRCVELASMEYPEMSDRGIMGLVGCSATTVGKYRPAGSRLGHVTGGDGRVYKVGSSAEMRDGVDDDPPVSDGAEDYVSDDEVREEVEGAESGSAVPAAGSAPMAYDVAYVCMTDKPGIAEVLPWVGESAPSYGELMTGSDVPVVRMRDAGGDVQNMVRRELVVEWCLSGADGEARWDGFRAKPVSLEHAERERERWECEQGRGDLVRWLSDTMDAMSQGLMVLPDDLVLSVVSKLVPREAVELMEDALKETDLSECESDDEVRMIKLVSMLLATPLQYKGADYVEVEMLGLSAEAEEVAG